MRHIFALLCLMALPLWGQKEAPKYRFSGHVQTDILVPQSDERISATPLTEKLLHNTYLQLDFQSPHLDAGLRGEWLTTPLPGYEAALKGRGIPHYFARLKYGRAALTLGTYYESLTNGLLLHTFEDRAMGIDNALRGAHLLWRPTEGVTLKAMAGQQRHYWAWSDAWVYAGELSLGLERIAPQIFGRQPLSVAVAWTTKDEQPDPLSRIVHSTDPQGRPHTEVFPLRQPRRVGALGFSLATTQRPWQARLDVAFKGQDPSLDNGYSFSRGHSQRLSLSHTRGGRSFRIAAQRAENMRFRSERTSTGLGATLNQLPTFTPPPTYALSSLYPYATQHVPGEWALNAEAGFYFKPKTRWGGTYGRRLRLHANHIRALDVRHARWTMGSDGWESRSYWAMGEQLYTDLQLSFEGRLRRHFTLHAAYQWLDYNQAVLQGHGDRVRAHLLAAEGRWRLSPKTHLRAEAQWLATADDQGHWFHGLLELSLARRWNFSIANQFNAHVPMADGTTAPTHYPLLSASYNHAHHRLTLGYGRTREGYNCMGGVCRLVPAQSGLRLHYTFSF